MELCYFQFWEITVLFNQPDLNMGQLSSLWFFYAATCQCNMFNLIWLKQSASLKIMHQIHINLKIDPYVSRYPFLVAATLRCVFLSLPI